MGEYTVRINGRLEYLLVCDTCGMRTTSIEHKEMLMKSIDCPMCKTKINTDDKGQISEQEFKADF